MHTAQAIMAYSKATATDLLGDDERIVRQQFKALARQWHPDANPGDPQAGRVFAHLAELRDHALAQLAGKMSCRTITGRRYRDADGRTFVLKPLAEHDGDLGKIIVSEHAVIYEFQRQNADLAEAEVERCATFRFADALMQEEFSRFLPEHVRTLNVEEDGIAHVFKRPGDTVLLNDLLRHASRLEPVHVAWVVSSLLNMACYLQWAGLVHGAISAENILVSPSMHSIILAGGWAYSTPQGTRPKALPRRTLALMPRLAVAGENASARVDLELVRAVGQDLLGCPGGAGLRLAKDVPDAMADWLVKSSGDDALTEYLTWGEALDHSFGKRRFVKLGINPKDIYGK